MPGQYLSKSVSDVTLIDKQLAEQSLAEVRQGLTVIHITGSEPQMDQFVPGVEDGMELESIEPAHRSLTAPGTVCKDLMASDAPVIANSDPQ